MKSNAIARIIIYAIVAIVLISILCGFLIMDTFVINIGSDNGTVVEGETSIDASEIKNIEIDWAAGSVEIIVTDADHITISEVMPEDSKYKMTYKISSNTLKLEYATGVFSIGFGDWSIPKKDLIITVPKDWICEELEIDGASLAINIQNLTIEKFDLDGASCDVFFAGSLDRIDIDGASTSLTLSCTNQISAINIDGASCDLDLTLPQGCGFLLQMDGLSCDLHTDLSGVTADGKTVYGNGHCKIDVDGISCDVTIAESECAHQWGPGMPTVDIVGGESEMLYTCLLCGESSTTGNTFQPKRPTE